VGIYLKPGVRHMKLTRQAARDLFDILSELTELPASLKGGVLETLCNELDEAQGAEHSEDRIVTIDIEKGDL